MRVSDKTYSGMIALPTYEERFDYLSLQGKVGQATFGFERWLNQSFYTSREWRQLRQKIILRDEGCDLAMRGFEIASNITIHHIVPISAEDFERGDPRLVDEDNLICVTHNTHMAIHYGDRSKLLVLPKERRPGDTVPWRRS